jgi:NAD(P)H-hydrate epimerase
MKKYNDKNKQNIKILNRRQSRDFDSWAINDLGIAGVVLMENAGRSVAEHVMGCIESSSSTKAAQTALICGTGNNGGDGFVIARHLNNAGYPVKVIICGQAEKIKGDAMANYKIAKATGISITQINVKDHQGQEVDEKVGDFIRDSEIIVDAVFGTGLQGQVRDYYLPVIEAVNRSGADVVAVDIPSGLDCDTGQPLGKAVKAHSTVTFAGLKKGFTQLQAAQYTGDIYVASIGIEPQSMNTEQGE